MYVRVFEDKRQAGEASAREGAELIRQALIARDAASIILATGASQFDTLKCLLAEPDIDWSRVTIFHLDEYVGLPASHPASFRLYLWDRFISRLEVPPKAYHFLDGEADAAAECERVGRIVEKHAIDVAFVGIGENGHLAFNDPPAEFDRKEPFLVVELDEECRTQQWREGWFERLEDVPRRALSMSVSQIMKSAAIVCTVPDERKAAAVRAALEGEVSPLVPASILRRHQHVNVYLDRPAASLLSEEATQQRRYDNAEAGLAPKGGSRYVFELANGILPSRE